MLIAPFNDLAETEAMIEAHHHDLAAVIMEPFQRLIAPQPGLPPGRAGDHRAARRAAHLRRDRHRVPLRLRRRPGILRRRARPGRLRQDRGRRFPPRRGRWAARDIMRHFSQETSEARLRRAGGHAQRQSDRRRRGPRHPRRAAPARNLRSPVRHRPPPQAGARGGRAARGPARAGGGRGAGVRDLLHRPADHRLPGHARPPIRPSTRPSPARCSRAAWSRRPRSSTCRSSIPRRRWRKPWRSSARR